jgi:hypothetical protein
LERRIDTHLFYIWVWTHLPSEYQKFKELEVLGISKGQRFKRTLKVKELMMENSCIFSKLVLGLLNFGSSLLHHVLEVHLAAELFVLVLSL